MLFVTHTETVTREEAPESAEMSHLLKMYKVAYLSRA